MYKNHRYTLLVGIILNLGVGLGWSAHWDDRLLEETREAEAARKGKVVYHKPNLAQPAVRSCRHGAEEQAAYMMATTASMMVQMQQMQLEEKKAQHRREDHERKDRQAQQAAQVQAYLAVDARKRAEHQARDQAIQHALEDMTWKETYGRSFTPLEQRAWKQFEEENTIDPNVAQVIHDTFVRERHQEIADEKAAQQQREEAEEQSRQKALRQEKAKQLKQQVLDSLSERLESGEFQGEEAIRVQGYISSRQISKDQAEQYLRDDATLKKARAIIEKNLGRKFYKDRGEIEGARVLLDVSDHRMILTAALAAEIVRHNEEYYVNYKKPLWGAPSAKMHK